jgi:hypothetical protein
MNSNFKLLFNHIAQDNLGNGVLNGEAQNIGSYPINNVMGVLHLYNSLENIVGITQGFPILNPCAKYLCQCSCFSIAVFQYEF